MHFRWNDWNIDHIAKHGVSPEEAEAAVLSARRPFPRFLGDRWLAVGRGIGGRWVQVIYLMDDDDESAFVIHARPLTDKEKRRYRRQQR